MALKDLLLAGARKMVLDVDPDRRELLVRRRLVKLLVNRGIAAAPHAEDLYDADCDGGFVIIHHTTAGRLFIAPRLLRVTHDVTTFTYDLRDEKQQAPREVLLGAATAAAGGLLMFMSVGLVGRTVLGRGITRATLSGARYASSAGHTGTGTALVVELPGTRALELAAVDELVAKRGGKLDLDARVDGSTLVLRSLDLTTTDVKDAAAKIVAEAKDLVGI